MVKYTKWVKYRKNSFLSHFTFTQSYEHTIGNSYTNYKLFLSYEHPQKFIKFLLVSHKKMK